jgi:hypothetical protein
MPVLGYVLPHIDCVIAVDMGIIGMSGDSSRDICLINYKNWCKLLSLENKQVRKLFNRVVEVLTTHEML